jgi:TetR/AcrR family transcriptional regulator, regulator of cefoperazone and chloramphenicol sensitivity
MATHDDTQERLVDAAGRIFAEKGYDGATVRDICQLAGVNLAAVNYYFRDKERLYIETVKSACQHQAEQFPLPEWPEGTPAVSKLRDFIKNLVRRMVDHPAHQAEWHRQLFLREMAQPTAACAEMVRDSIRPMAEVLSQILGEIAADLPERKRWLIGFSIVGQAFFHKIAWPIVSMLVGEEEHRTYDAALLTEHITQFSLAALGLEQPIRKLARGKGSASRRRPAKHTPKQTEKLEQEKTEKTKKKS